MIVVVNLLYPPAHTVTHSEVRRTFTEGGFFCIDEPDGLFRYLRTNIWLLVEKPDEEPQDEEKDAE